MKNKAYFYNAVTFFMGASFIGFTLPFNLVGSYPLAYSILSIIYGSLSLILFFNGRYFQKKFYNVITHLVHVSLFSGWFFTAGFDGIMMYLYFLPILTAITFQTRRAFFITLGLITLEFIIFFWVSAFHPNWITPYLNSREKTIDFAIELPIYIGIGGLFIYNIYQSRYKKKPRQ